MGVIKHFRDDRRPTGARYFNRKYGVQMPVVCADDFVTLSDRETVTTKIEDVTCINCAVVVTNKVERYRTQR